MIRFIGMDFEATGSDPWGLHAPIEIGLAVRRPDVEASEPHQVCGPLCFPAVYQGLMGRWNWKEWEWDEEAAAVHQIPKADIDKAPPVWQTDIKAASWLIEQGIASNRLHNVAVGYNVSGYDRQFVTRHMPNLNRILSYRTVDLNTLTYAVSGDSEKDYSRVKRETKDYAAAKIVEALRIEGKHETAPATGGVKFDWHRGHYDAVAALYSMDYLNMRLRGEVS